MKENSEMLNEVVVIGYGTMDKKELTSAISHVGEKDFLSVSSLDPSMMIQGKVRCVDHKHRCRRPEQSGKYSDKGCLVACGRSLDPLIVIDGVRAET